MEAEILWRRYLDGDRAAFDGIVDILRENLIFFINRYTHDLDVAEDISQDVFLALLMNPKKYDFRVKLKTYLFTIAHNKALNYVKKSRKTLLLSDSESEKSSEYEAFEEKIFSDEEKRRLSCAIKKLNQDYAEVIHLIYFEDMSYDEAGRVMRKSRKQIENLVSRARNSLRNFLEREGIKGL